MSFSARICVAAAISVCIATTALGDWPQYRGPSHDGISTEKMLASWPAGGPKVLWKIPVGPAFGSFAIRGGTAWYLAEENGQELCYAINARTGKRLWATAIGKTIHEGSGGNGPRSTPVVAGNRVYVLGTYFKLMCFDAASGKVVWQHDLAQEYKGQTRTGGIREWGQAASPIVSGNLVIVAGGGPGESFMGFDKLTGAVVWKSGDEKVTHATATPATILGVPQIIFFVQSGLVSVDPKSGRELWRYPFPFSVSTAASPVVGGDIVYCSAGYGVGAGACRITRDITRGGDRFIATEIWRAKGKNINHWSTPVLKDGYLYGLYGFKEFKTEPLKCIELATGKEIWSHPGFGQGQVVMIDGKLLVQGDQGQLVLVEPTPAGYKEISRCQPLAGKAWGFPAYSDGLLLYRTDHQAAGVDLAPGR